MERFENNNCGIVLVCLWLSTVFWYCTYFSPKSVRERWVINHSLYLFKIEHGVPFSFYQNTFFCNLSPSWGWCDTVKACLETEVWNLSYLYRFKESKIAHFSGRFFSVSERIMFLECFQNQNLMDHSHKKSLIAIVQWCFEFYVKFLKWESNRFIMEDMINIQGYVQNVEELYLRKILEFFSVIFNKRL